jgi:hypothetical protein
MNLKCAVQLFKVYCRRKDVSMRDVTCRHEYKSYGMHEYEINHTSEEEKISVGRKLIIVDELAPIGQWVED